MEKTGFVHSSSINQFKLVQESEKKRGLKTSTHLALLEVLPARIIEQMEGKPKRLYVVLTGYEDPTGNLETMGIEQFQSLFHSRSSACGDLTVLPTDPEKRRQMLLLNVLRDCLGLPTYTYIEREEIELVIREAEFSGYEVMLLRAIPYGDPDHPDEVLVNQLASMHSDSIRLPYNQADFIITSNKAKWAEVERILRGEYIAFTGEQEQASRIQSEFERQICRLYPQINLQTIKDAIEFSRISAPQSVVAHEDPRLLESQIRNLPWKPVNDIVCALKFSNTASGFGTILITKEDLETIDNEVKIKGRLAETVLMELILKKLPVIKEGDVNKYDLLTALKPYIRGATIQKPYIEKTPSGLDEISATFTLPQIKPDTPAYTKTQPPIQLLLTTKNNTQGTVHHGNIVSLSNMYLEGTVLKGREDILGFSTLFNYFTFMTLNGIINNDQNGVEELLTNHPSLFTAIDMRFEKGEFQGKTGLVPVVTDQNFCRTNGNTAAEATFHQRWGYREIPLEIDYSGTKVTFSNTDYMSTSEGLEDLQMQDFVSDSEPKGISYSSVQNLANTFLNQKVVLELEDRQELTLPFMDCVDIYTFAPVKGKLSLGLVIPDISVNGADCTDQVREQVLNQALFKS